MCIFRLKSWSCFLTISAEIWSLNGKTTDIVSSVSWDGDKGCCWPSYVNFSRQHRFKCCNLHDLFYIYLDNGVMTTPKRRILSFVFKVLCFKKSLLIRILKRDNQLHLFRRLEQCSKKQINCDGSIEFLRPCQNFELTPTFAKINKERSSKWKQSSEAFERNVISEELKEKIKYNQDALRPTGFPDFKIKKIVN